MLGTALAAVLALMFWTREPPPEPPPPNQAPGVTLVADTTSATAPATINFAASAWDPDGTIASYSWEYGSGPMAGTDTQSLTYRQPTLATVIVTVTDNAGATASASATVTIKEPPYPRTSVKRYSTLYGIAHRKCEDGSRWTEIQTLNGGIDPHALQEGDELKLPLDCRSDLPSLPINTVTYYTVAAAETPASDTRTASVPASNGSSIASASQLDHASQVSASLDYVSDDVSFAGIDLAPVQIVTTSSLPVSDYVVAPAPSVSASIVRDAPFAVHWYETTG